MKQFVLSLIMMAAMVAQAQMPGQRSRTVTDSIHSNVLDAYREYTVYLPAEFYTEPESSFPVLYLLHGMSGTNICWFRDQRAAEVMDQLVASGEACPMVIVSPNAGGNVDEEWNGYFNMPGWNYEDFFFTEFVPFIEKTYRCGGSKDKRAVAGLSMGGGGTTVYAQHHPEMFCAAYPMSALMDIPEFGKAGGDTPQGKVGLLTESVRRNSCIEYVKNASDEQKAGLKSVRWYVDCGDDDFLLDRNIEFMQAMRNAGIPMEFRVRDGGHTNEYWHTALFTALPFVSRCFSKP